MKKVLLGTIAMAAMLAVPAISLADTYQYVNTSGTISSVTADTAYGALIAAPDIAPHSGVIDETTTAGITAPTAPVTITTTVPVTTTEPTTTTDSDTISSYSTDTTTDSGLTLAGTYMSTASSTMDASTTPGVATSNIASSTLVLSQNGTASLMTMYDNDGGSMTQTGTWSQIGTNGVQVTLTSNGTMNYNPAQTITFSANDGTLTATSYNTSMYGSEGLTLTEENS